MAPWLRCRPNDAPKKIEAAGSVVDCWWWWFPLKGDLINQQISFFSFVPLSRLEARPSFSRIGVD
ncbi:uncharacterized protein CLUP02_01302 [Colletotrichum lupini]|uniref:Uncharacterized protein n=1 Tax=Colletotrichum lupini TaxID=145971 RepID=A0A9Q8SCY7_9PEZI|nr:uncharacterized protein CLUP02_01302 [Colletotrichum lupini]UQC74651.1 hypothetical protein CLUP02_01302 [Colletotrichum lupini]